MKSVITGSRLKGKSPLGFAGVVCVATALSLLLCTTSFGFASSLNNHDLNGVKLTGSRQGQSVGFVDINGDGTDEKIVGAPFASVPSHIGVVLVYAGMEGGEFSSVPSRILSGDENFGYSFVNLGDVDEDGKEDFAVGAINGGGPDVSLSGSVTVYKGGVNRNIDKGRDKVIAKLSGEGPMDKFGLCVSSGDLNNDGLKDLIVGAPFNTVDPAVYQGGAVYVFFAPDFTERVALHATTLNKGLGWSSAAGDINGDNITDLCISASGKALCYYGALHFNPSTDSPDVTIKSTSSGFGKALAVIEDLNGDGFGEIVIGAPNAVVNGKRDTGSIYVINGGDGIMTLTADTSPALIVRISGTDLFDRFGASIAVIDNADCGHMADVAVGSPMADLDDSNRLAGKVYLFSGEDLDDAASPTASMVFDGFAGSQGFGASLAVADNSMLLIGAPRSDSDTGWVSTVDLSTGQSGPGGSSDDPPGSDEECD